MSDLKPCEAIEILESIYPSKKQIVTGEYPEVAEALDMAIVTLRRVQPANEPLMLILDRIHAIPPETFVGTYGDFELVESVKDSCCEAVEDAYRRKPERSENDA